MESSFPLTINGVTRRVSGDSGNQTLLAYLRSNGLTGAKEGCDVGECGSCSVAMLGRDASGRPAWRAINSCITPLTLVAGKELVTVEGVGGDDPDDLHSIQAQLIRYGGSQCGYCTPGIVMSLFEAFHRQDLETNGQFDEQIAGNLCRCTGYRPIRDAAVAALVESGERDGEESQFKKKLGNPIEQLEQFDFIDADGRRFFRPITIEQTLRLLKHYQGATLIAGGTEIGVEINRDHADPRTVISLEAVSELTMIITNADSFEVGAAATLTDFDDIVGKEIRMVREILSVFGSRQIRNRATIGGNLANASPVADLPPVLMALEAQVRLVSSEGERSVPVHRFLTDYRETCLREGEFIKSIIIPRRTNDSPLIVRRVYKVSNRRESDIATITAAFSLTFDEGKISSAILAFSGVADTVMRASQTEAFLRGREWDLETANITAGLLPQVFAPISDHRGSAEYRQALTGSLFMKFYHEHPRPGSLPVEHSAVGQFRNPDAPAASHYPGES